MVGMNKVIKQRHLVTLIFSLFIGSVAASGVSINHTARTVDWTDGTESWQYFLSNSDWAWDNNSNTWTYTEATKSWQDDLADDYWVYDTTNDVWASSTDGTYDLSTANSFSHHVWRYVSSTKQWHSVQRTEAPLTFITDSSAHWSFDPTAKEWTFSRAAAAAGGGRTYDNVIIGQVWTFATDDSLQWEQKSPSAGKQWDYNRVNQTWIDLTADPDDVWAFKWPETEPNFITQKKVVAKVVTSESRDLLIGSLVCIPSADPGIDWLFSYPIAGLITAWGGVNSHMAIRASELGLPAVIGSGETLYRHWASANTLLLDCAGRRVEVLS